MTTRECIKCLQTITRVNGIWTAGDGDGATGAWCYNEEPHEPAEPLTLREVLEETLSFTDAARLLDDLVVGLSVGARYYLEFKTQGDTWMPWQSGGEEAIRRQLEEYRTSDDPRLSRLEWRVRRTVAFNDLLDW